MSMHLQSIKERVALANRIMYYEGLCEQVGNERSGHVSVKLDDGRIVMPAHLHEEGGGMRVMGPEHMLVLNLDGKLLEGKYDIVEEVVIHTHVYRARSEVRSVAHVHAPAATALGSTDQTILPLSLRAAYFADGVPVLERGPGIIDSEDIAHEMVERMGKHNVIIHKGHGIVTAGQTLQEACLNALYLEGAARNQLMIRQFGGNVKPFDKDACIQFAKTHSLLTRKGLWEYYENKWRKAAKQKE